MSSLLLNLAGIADYSDHVLTTIPRTPLFLSLSGRLRRESGQTLYAHLQPLSSSRDWGGGFVSLDGFASYYDICSPQTSKQQMYF